MTGLIIVNVICIVFAIIFFGFFFAHVLKMAKEIERLKSEKQQVEESADYHKNALKTKAGIEENGFELGERNDL